jgi:hypothetical protein
MEILLCVVFKLSQDYVYGIFQEQAICLFPFLGHMN